MTSRNWFLASLLGCGLMLSAAACVAPASKTCKTESDCFAGETCGPDDLCVPESQADTKGSDTESPGDGVDDPDGTQKDAGDTGGTDTDEPTDSGPTDGGDGGPGDGGPGDGGPGDGGPGDADTQDGGTDLPPTDFYFFTSGGGTGMSSSYDIQVRIGAPTAGLQGESNTYRLQLAPVRR